MEEKIGMISHKWFTKEESERPWECGVSQSFVSLLRELVCIKHLYKEGK